MSSMSAMVKSAAIVMKTMREMTDTKTWMRYGMDQQSAAGSAGRGRGGAGAGGCEIRHGQAAVWHGRGSRWLRCI